MALAERWTHRSMEENKNTEIDPHKYAQLTFDKDAEVIQWKEHFNKWCFNNWVSTGQKKNLKLNLKPCTKINSKWITGLNVKCKLIKLWRGEGENLQDQG